MNSTVERRGPSVEVKIITISFKVIAIIATIFGNSLVFRAFHKFPSLRTASNSILVSLSVAGTLTVIPFILHMSSIALIKLGDIKDHLSLRLLCVSSARLSHLLMSVIILHLAVISVERVIAIKFALRYFTIVTYRRAVAACVLVWLWAVAVTFLFPLALKEDTNESAYARLYEALHPCFKCREGPPTMPSSTRGYLVFFVTSLLVIPILIILCSYGYVFAVSHKHRKQIRQQGQTQENLTINNELKGAYTLAIVVGVCLLSFLPLLVVTSYRFFGAPQFIHSRRFLKYIVYDVALGLNGCLNPVIYGWRHKELKKAFRKLLKCA